MKTSSKPYLMGAAGLILSVLLAAPAGAADVCGGDGIEPASSSGEVAQFKQSLEDARGGDVDAQMEVAADYRDGTGTRKNLVEAFAWFNVAAQRSGEAAEARDKIANRCFDTLDRLEGNARSLELLN